LVESRPVREGDEPGPIDLRVDGISIISRRDILLAAAGGVALAANGLLLPGSEPASAEANDAAGVSIERSRRKRRRRRRRGEAPGSNFFKASALTFENKTRDQVLNCTFCYSVKTGLDDYSLPFYNFTRGIQPGEVFRYDPTNPERYRLGVFVKGVDPGLDLYADVRNVSFWWPRGGIFTGANLDPATGNFGAPFIAEQNFDPGEERKRVKIVLKRRDNSDGCIEWLVTIGEGHGP
jgi:hypothetical protein